MNNKNVCVEIGDFFDDKIKMLNLVSKIKTLKKERD